MSFTSRPILMSDAGMVVSGHHLASEAGAAVLRAGGNAFDAAIAAATTLAVAIPNMNGVGGDAIALCYVREDDSVYAINGSGRSPQAATLDAFAARGLTQIPQTGPLAMTVCGAPHAWHTVLERFGTTTLSDALAPAIALAEAGVPTDTVLQTFFAGETYRELAAKFPQLAEVYGPPGHRALGERFHQPQLGRTLRKMSEQGVESLYGGEIGDALIADLDAAGSLLTLEDLAAHETLISETLSVPFLGRRLHVAPPNSQGIALAFLAALWQADGAQALAPDLYLRLKHLAFGERDRAATDPDRSGVAPGPLDGVEFASILASKGDRNTEARAGGGDTSTLVVVDRWGNAVSWVQSLFEDFGSGVISPSTGIVMHNRLYLEELSDHPTRGLRPGTRPFHTLCPALVIGEDGCDVAIATPGDHGQPQSIFQVLLNLFKAGMNIQQAIEAPRIRHDTGDDVMLEARAPGHWREEIERSGFAVRDVGDWSRLMGGVNAIVTGPDGVLMGGADPRRACHAVSG
ncbi:gamma-glutamyltransferase family protein [Pelagibacterium montanilacus]|uniref:gamma-glutamyltransferase family protein n=1 Tax=Pelagibacterium montanilacus TaxID=2185280 RepID=UPI0013DED2A6|nr:gamma-glutamyltransferase [Pelagibacterium montanilacus]